MLLNYLKVAFRHLWKNKGFSVINIMGLSLGLAATMLILLWVRDERQIDTFSSDPARVYQVYQRATTNGKTEGGVSTQALLAQEMKRRLPQVEAASGSGWADMVNFSVGTKHIQRFASYADTDFFRIFSYPLLEGNAGTALSDPSNIAISRKTAVVFFGSPEAAMGKTMRFENQVDLKVSAVYEDIDVHQSARPQCLLTWALLLKNNDWLKQWGNSGPLTYVLLKPGTNVRLFRANLQHFLDTYIKPDPNYKHELDIQLFSETYLHGALRTGYPSGGRIEYVRLLTTIAFFVLFIACINFMNLTTGRSMRRAREVGIRKVMGAVRARLVLQFIGEALIVALLSLCIALTIVAISLPAFNGLTNKHIELPYNTPLFWGSLATLTLVTGVLSGSYPAFYLSSFRPVVVLKGGTPVPRMSLPVSKQGGRNSGSLKTSLLRRGLVVFQFVLSIVLITGALVISRQINYIRHKDLGYDRQNLVYFPLNADLARHFSAFHDKIAALPGVTAVTATSDVPTNVYNSSSDLDWPGKDPKFIPRISILMVTYDLVSTLKLHMAAGRDFSKDMPTDSSAYVINESAAAMMGMKDPIGKRVSSWGRWGTIIGVVKDFHFQSLHDPISPIIFRPAPADNMGVLLVRYQPGETHAVLDGLGKIYKEMSPDYSFSFAFADEEFSKLYKSDEITGTLSTLFASLAIVISCLGLLGLSFFSIEQRTKEIGIRKILGAQSGRLFVLLSTEFIVLIGIAFVLATPLAWWAMHRWLAGFAYQTPVGWGIFALGGIAAIAMALGTVSYQAWKAATGNPTKSLRNE